MANFPDFLRRLQALIKIEFPECKLHFEKLLFIDEP
jgi:hypothetical protein